jgi:GT2 family glycosyltransferase
LTQDYTSFAESSAQVTASIVSHGHGAMVTSLLMDLAKQCGSSVNVILTLNIQESLMVNEGLFPFRLEVIRNASPNGFGANHNAAFMHSRSAYFCVLNPDIRIHENPFPQLVNAIRQPDVGVVAPKIVGPTGCIEDSARRFPTPWLIARKLFGLSAGLDYRIDQMTQSPDWVAGMFMLFRKDVFAELAGFDKRYFMYYEDVDLCRRLRKRGYDVRLLPSVTAMHDARRKSHRSLRHLRWHLASMLRFMTTG